MLLLLSAAHFKSFSQSFLFLLPVTATFSSFHFSSDCSLQFSLKLLRDEQTECSLRFCDFEVPAAWSSEGGGAFWKRLFFRRNQQFSHTLVFFDFFSTITRIVSVSSSIRVLTKSSLLDFLIEETELASLRLPSGPYLEPAHGGG